MSGDTGDYSSQMKYKCKNDVLVDIPTDFTAFSTLYRNYVTLFDDAIKKGEGTILDTLHLEAKHVRLLFQFLHALKMNETVLYMEFVMGSRKDANTLYELPLFAKEEFEKHDIPDQIHIINLANYLGVDVVNKFYNLYMARKLMKCTQMEDPVAQMRLACGVSKDEKFSEYQGLRDVYDGKISWIEFVTQLENKN